MNVQLSTRIGIDANLPWEDHMSLGSGFNANDMQSAKSPFLQIEVPLFEDLPANRKTNFQHQFIKNSEDFKRALRIAVDVSASVSLVPASSSVTFLKSVECNSTHVATFIRCTITAPKQLFSSEPHLTEPAAEYLSKNGAESFIQRYGSHFIAGQICQSTFSLMLMHTTADSKDSEQLIQDLNVNYANLAEMSSFTGLKETLKKSKFDTRVRLAMTGSTFTDVKAFLSLDDIVPTFVAWKAALQPEPYAAIIRHHCLVIDEIPRPVSRWKIPTDLVDAYESLLLLQMKIRSAHPVEPLQPLLNSVENLERRLIKIEVPDSDWKSHLQQWSKEFEQKNVEFTDIYQPIQKRRELLQMVLDSQKTSSWPKNKKLYPGQITEFRTGITSPGHFDQYSSEVGAYIWFFSKVRKPDTNGIVQKEVCEFGIHGDRIIVGIEAISDREEEQQHNNGWFTLQEGGVGTPYVRLFFETSHWRPSEWSVKIWHVEKKLYSV